MATIIFALFVLYTLACVMDGQDVKPKWKGWLGGKLEGMANELKPINYCLPHSPLCPKYVSPFERAIYQNNVAGMQMLQCSFVLGEQILYEARMNEHLAKVRGGIPIPSFMTVSGLVDDAKRRCVASILNEIEKSGLIDIEINEECTSGRMNVCGRLYVKKPNNYLR